MALLQLSQPSTAPTMPVITPSDESWAYQDGNTVLVAGWGRTNLNSTATSHLNWLDLAIQNDTYCYRQFTGHVELRPGVDVLRIRSGDDRLGVQRRQRRAGRLAISVRLATRSSASSR